MKAVKVIGFILLGLLVVVANDLAAIYAYLRTVKPINNGLLRFRNFESL